MANIHKIINFYKWPNIFLSNRFCTTSRRPWLYSWVRMSHFSACILVIGILDYTSLCLGMLCVLRSFLPDLIRHLAFKIFLQHFWILLDSLGHPNNKGKNKLVWGKKYMDWSQSMSICFDTCSNGILTPIPDVKLLCTPYFLFVVGKADRLSNL